MSSVKREARLSGMLLARKGTALPAHTEHCLTVHAMENFAEQNNENEQVTCDQPDKSRLVKAIDEIKAVTRGQWNNVLNEPENSVKTEPKQEVSQKSSKVLQVVKRDGILKSNKDSASKRIAMTLRMEKEDHLKLRLFSAHSKKSCQKIISAALDVYLSEKKKYIV